MEKPKFRCDENLRDIPGDANYLREYVEHLKLSFESTSTPKEQVRLLGEIGVYLRSLQELDQAQQILCRALDIVFTHRLGMRYEIQQKIRLAHVLQWQRRFHESNKLFDEIIQVCKSSCEVSSYLDFAYQHAGKNSFDQAQYMQALDFFQKALMIRERNSAAKEQIESSRHAIHRVEQLMKLPLAS